MTRSRPTARRAARTLLAAALALAALLLWMPAASPAASALPCNEVAVHVQYAKGVGATGNPCTPSTAQLPASGYGLLPVALIGLLLLAVGLVLRRRPRSVTTEPS